MQVPFNRLNHSGGPFSQEMQGRPMWMISALQCIWDVRWRPAASAVPRAGVRRADSGSQGLRPRKWVRGTALSCISDPPVPVQGRGSTPRTWQEAAPACSAHRLAEGGRPPLPASPAGTPVAPASRTRYPTLDEGVVCDGSTTDPGTTFPCHLDGPHVSLLLSRPSAPGFLTAFSTLHLKLFSQNKVSTLASPSVSRIQPTPA